MAKAGHSWRPLDYRERAELQGGVKWEWVALQWSQRASNFISEWDLVYSHKNALTRSNQLEHRNLVQPDWLSGRATLGFHLLEGFFYLVVIFDHHDSPVKSVLLSFHKWGNWGLVQGHAGRKQWSWACLTSKHLSILPLLMITQSII